MPVTTITYHYFMNVYYEYVHVLHVTLLSAEWCWMFYSMCDALFCIVQHTFYGKGSLCYLWCG